MENMFFESLKKEYFVLVESREKALFLGDHDKIKTVERIMGHIWSLLKEDYYKDPEIV
jgi:hypothetical protein